MRGFFIFTTGWLLLATGCTPRPVPSRPPHTPQAPRAVRQERTPPPPVAPSPVRVETASAAEKTRVTGCELHGITFEGVAFDSRTTRLRVADQADGPGSRWPDAAAAMRAFGGLAAANAGFFTPEGQPLGRLVANGTAAGAWNSSSLGNGMWLERADGSCAIVRRGGATTGARELLQAGPLLVENGKSATGLEASKSAVRTLLAWDGGTRWWLGRSSPCTLAELGAALAGGGPAGWPVREALNLDGGRSSDLAVSAQVPGGPLERRGFFNRPVRNFLVLAPR